MIKNKISKYSLLKLRPVANYVHFPMSLKRRPSVHVIASFDRTVASVIQFAEFFRKRAKHDDYRLCKPWELQLLHNEVLERGVVVGKLWKHHKWVGRPWNKDGRCSSVELREGDKTTIFGNKICYFDEESITPPKCKNDFIFSKKNHISRKTWMASTVEFDSTIAVPGWDAELRDSVLHSGVLGNEDSLVKLETLSWFSSGVNTIPFRGIIDPREESWFLARWSSVWECQTFCFSWPSDRQLGLEDDDICRVISEFENIPPLSTEVKSLLCLSGLNLAEQAQSESWKKVRFSNLILMNLLMCFFCIGKSFLNDVILITRIYSRIYFCPTISQGCGCQLLDCQDSHSLLSLHVAIDFVDVAVQLAPPIHVK